MSDALQAAEVDPATLALFTQPVTPPGRSRGAFSMTGEPRRQATPDPHPEEGPVVRVVPAPRVQRALEGEIDWDLVDILRERLSAELTERDPDPVEPPPSKERFPNQLPMAEIPLSIKPPKPPEPPELKPSF